jgi:enamine deaminase RidA (YjgF/YER057c/UK114 family)
LSDGQANRTGLDLVDIRDVHPASRMVKVSGLVSPEMLVEIEAVVAAPE